MELRRWQTLPQWRRAIRWLAIDFFCIILYATDNAFFILALALVAFSVASAMFLLLELEGPLSGFIRVPVEPLERAVKLLGR